MESGLSIYQIINSAATEDDAEDIEAKEDELRAAGAPNESDTLGPVVAEQQQQQQPVAEAATAAMHTPASPAQQPTSSPAASPTPTSPTPASDRARSPPSAAPPSKRSKTTPRYVQSVRLPLHCAVMAFFRLPQCATAADQPHGRHLARQQPGHGRDGRLGL